MTAPSRMILLVLPFAVLPSACGAARDSGEPDSGALDSTGSDSTGSDSTGSDSTGGDWVAPTETGTAATSFYGHFLTYAGGDAPAELVGGAFGLSAITQVSLGGQLADLDVLCTLAGALVDVGDAPPCADCDWAFHIQVVDTVVTGSACDDLPWRDGALDGWSGAWGFADSQVIGPYVLTDLVFYYFKSPYNSWYPVAYTYAGVAYGGYSGGTAEDATFQLPTAYTYSFSP